MKYRNNALLSVVMGLLLLSSCAKPIANFTFKGAEKEAPTEVRFENKSEKAKEYEWDFGDDTKSTEASPKHEYKTSGNYTVTLKAKKGKKEAISEQQVFIQAPKDCLVELQTDFGNMIIRLSNATPKHRDNFIKLVEEGFYDGLLFHRVINGFMIQGGDPRSRNARKEQNLGGGGPGYQIPAEFVDTLAHVKGALAAARTGDAVNPQRKSSGSQFYIVDGQTLSDKQIDRMEAQRGIKYTPEQRRMYKELGGTAQLDQGYTVFGQVIKGLDVIDKIAAVQTNQANRPLEDVKMTMRVID